MRHRPFLRIAALVLLVLPRSVQADLAVAKAVEEQSVHFNSSDFKLSPDSRLILDQTISLLAQMNEGYSIKVMGFTDSQGPEQINQDLSVQRANTVATYMISKGIDRNRILIQGLGRENPVADNETEEGRLQNRRVEFKFISPDTSNLRLTASTEMVAANEPKEEEIISVSPTVEAAPSPLVTTPAPEAPTPAPQPEPVKEQPAPTPAVVVPTERREDTMLAVDKRKKARFTSNHIYEKRKRSDQGQTYVQISPIWMNVNGLSNLGAGDDDVTSKTSFRGEAGWVSFMDDNYDTFVTARGYASFLRFGQNAGAGLGTKQKEFTFGGDLGLGRYFHPNFFIQIKGGYGTELVYLTRSGIDFDSEYIAHFGLSAEVVAWRFTEMMDIGVAGFVDYYDLGSGNLNSGSAYGFNLFYDYDFLRASFDFNFLNLETTTFDFDAWWLGPTVRLYF